MLMRLTEAEIEELRRESLSAVVLDVFRQHPLGIYPAHLKNMTGIGMRDIRVCLARLEAQKEVEYVRGDQAVPNDEGMDPNCYYRLA